MFNRGEIFCVFLFVCFCCCLFVCLFLFVLLLLFWGFLGGRGRFVVGFLLTNSNYLLVYMRLNDWPR